MPPVTALRAEPVRVQEGLGSSADNDAAHQQFVFAYRLLQRGENSLATEAFDEYLLKFPADVKRSDALYYRALLARKAGDNPAAAALLQKVAATTVVPSFAVNLLRGQVHYDLGEYDHAVAALEQIETDQLQPPVKASVHYLRGLAYRGVNNLPAAEAQLRQATQTPGPLRGRATLDLARVQSLAARDRDAIVTLEPCLSDEDPALRAESLCLAGDLSYQAARYDDAARLYRTVLNDHANAPQLSRAVIGLLWCRYQTKQYEGLFEAFDRYHAALADQDRVVAWYLAGSARQEMGRHDEAVALLNAVRVGALDSPIHDKILYKLAVSQFELGQIHDMTQTLATLARVYPQSPLNTDATFLAAAAAAKQGDTANGISRLSTIIALGPGQPYYAQALLQRAKLYELSQQTRFAIDDYRRYLDLSVDRYPEQSADDSTPTPPDGEIEPITPVRSDADAALHTPTAAGGPDPRHEVLLRLTDLYYSQSDYEPAKSAASRLLAMNNVNPTIRQEAAYRLALALIKLQDHPAAWQQLNALLTAPPPPPETLEAHARYYRGLVAMALEKDQQALEDLQAASVRSVLPADLRANALRLVAIRQRQAGQDVIAAETLVRLELIVGTDRLDPPDLVWLGRHFLGHGDPQKADKYLQPVLRAKTGVRPDVRAEALYLSGRYYQATNQWDQAITAFQHVVAVAAGFELQAKLELARSLAAAQRTDDALAAFGELVTVEQADVASAALYDSAAVHRDLALRSREAGNKSAVQDHNQEARKLLKRLVLLYPYVRLSPLPQRAYLELAELTTTLDQPQQAQREYREMIENFPTGPYASFGRAMLALSQNRQGDARFLLTELRTQDLDPYLSARVQRQLSNLVPGGNSAGSAGASGGGGSGGSGGSRSGGGL